MSRTAGHAGSILQLSQGMLHCLLKSSLALEIDAAGGVGGPGCLVWATRLAVWGKRACT